MGTLSIYSRLFRYKARPDREPLEDFLTEALADLLTRMGPTEARRFLDWAYQAAQEKPDWSWIDDKPLEWATQVAVPNGIADLVLFVGGKPVLVVENKTWSGYQDHGTDDQPATQVTTYCNWLSSAADRAGPRAMLLLTGTTEAPEGYHADGKFAVASRAQVTWAAFGRWLKAETEASVSGLAPWRSLAGDFVDFLKEKKLNSEVFTSADLAAASLMLPTMERWRSSFSTMWSSADEVCRRFLKPRISDLSFHIEGGLLWQYRYGTADRTPQGSYIALALRFPEQSQWYQDLRLPEHPHFAVIIASDTGCLTTSHPLPEGWLQDDDGFIASLPVHRLSLAADRRTHELQEWAKAVFAEAEAILSNSKLAV